MEKWVEEITAGQSVVYRGEIYQVSRVTPSRIMVSIPNLAGQMHARAFHKKTLREVGDNDSWHFEYLKEATSDAVAKIFARNKRNAIIKRIMPKLWGSVSDEQVAAIERILFE